ncbi:MAG: T9SS type A sorting domain-containing protein [Crocinitomicaceae bacterium]
MEAKFEDVHIAFNGLANNIQISGMNQDFGKATIELVDLSGKIVEKIKQNDISGNFVWTLENNYEGIYLISIRNKKEKVVRKIFMH